MRLKFGLFALVLGLSLFVVAAPSDAPDVFSNPTAGFEMKKPKEWFFLTAAERQESLDTAKLESSEFEEAARKYATVPMVTISKFKEPHEDVNPCIEVKIRPLGGFKDMPPREILEVVLPVLTPALKDAKVVKPPMETKVSDIPSGYARIDYTFQTTAGLSFPTTSEIWVVPRGEHYFVIAGATRQDEKNGTRAEIRAIVGTIKIKPEK